MSQYVVMVDPYTSSERICDAFLERGIHLIGILTDRIQVPEDAKKMRLPVHKIEKIYSLNSDNCKEILTQIQKLNIIGVVSGCEMSNDISDRLSNLLCPEIANPLSSIDFRMNKFEMQEALKRNGLNAVKQLKISQPFLYEEQKKQFSNFEFPIILKPVGTNGSFKVFYCENINQINQALFETIGLCYSRYGVTVKEMVVQECLKGIEYAVDSVSYQGKHKFIGVQRYFKTMHDNRPIYRFSEMVNPKSDAGKTCIEYVEKVLSAVELQNGLAHTEIFLTKNGPYLIEVNPRVSGAFGFLNKMAKLMYAYDQADGLVNIFATPETFSTKNQERTNQYSRCIFIQNWIQKQMKEFSADKLKELPSYKEHLVVKKPGQLLNPVKELGDVVALVLLLSEKKKEIEMDTAQLFEFEKKEILF